MKGIRIYINGIVYIILLENIKNQINMLLKKKLISNQHHLYPPDTKLK
jgi:hypothetical protein